MFSVLVLLPFLRARTQANTDASRRARFEAKNKAMQERVKAHQKKLDKEREAKAQYTINKDEIEQERRREMRENRLRQTMWLVFLRTVTFSINVAVAMEAARAERARFNTSMAHFAVRIQRGWLDSRRRIRGRRPVTTPHRCQTETETLAIPLNSFQPLKSFPY